MQANHRQEPVRIIRRTANDDESSLANEMLDRGIIFVHGPIGPEISCRFAVEAMCITQRDPDQLITVYINSPGGSVYDGLAIIDVCRSLPNPVATVGSGVCASMGAALLVCAGEPGQRSAMPNCEIMLHQPLTGVSGQATDIAIAAEHIVKLRTRLYSMIAAACAQPVAKVTADFERDRWFTAAEALDYGLIDRLEAPRKPLACATTRHCA